MREMVRHTAGWIFITVLFASTVALMYVTRFFTSPVLVFGWMTLPLAAGVAFTLVWLAAYLIYFFKFWPYR